MTILGFVDVKDFGAIGDGSADDTTAIQAAINTGNNVYFPKGAYKINSPLVTNIAAQRFNAANEYATTIVSSNAIDLFRIAHNRCLVENIGFNAPAGGLGIRIYAPYTHLRRIRVLSGSNNNGSGIVIQDHTPANVGVPGAYVHIIENCSIGYSGFAFATGISCDSPSYGVQACKFINNIFCGNKFIDMAYGGGNTYSGNLFQSSTGSTGTPVGDCLSFGTTVTGEMIFGNYFERYTNGVKSTRTDNTHRIVNAKLNEYESCTNSVTCAVTNYLNDELDSHGIPTGGTTGQALLKNSSTNFDASWGTVSGGGGTFSLLTGGTAIGDMTSGGALSVAFDGTISKIYGNTCVYKASSTNGYVGKDWGSTKTVTKYEIYGTSDYGYDSTSSLPINITAALKGSSDGSAWTTLHTQTFVDNNTTNSKSVTSGITLAPYRYHAVFLSNDNGTSNPPILAQVKFYETV